MEKFPLPKMFLNAAAIGLGISALLIAILWLFNVNGFFDAIGHSKDALLALVMIWLSNGMLFAAVQVSYAVVRAGNDD